MSPREEHLRPVRTHATTVEESVGRLIRDLRAGLDAAMMSLLWSRREPMGRRIYLLLIDVGRGLRDEPQDVPGDTLVTLTEALEELPGQILDLLKQYWGGASITRLAHSRGLSRSRLVWRLGLAKELLGRRLAPDGA